MSLQESLVLGVKAFHFNSSLRPKNTVFQYTVAVLKGTEVEAMLAAWRRFKSVNWTQLNSETTLVF